MNANKIGYIEYNLLLKFERDEFKKYLYNIEKQLE